jgi:hypothetical protein
VSSCVTCQDHRYTRGQHIGVVNSRYHPGIIESARENGCLTPHQ